MDGLEDGRFDGSEEGDDGDGGLEGCFEGILEGQPNPNHKSEVMWKRGVEGSTATTETVLRCEQKFQRPTLLSTGFLR
jgi:hypothetical protein